MRKEFKLALVIAIATAGVFTSNVLNAQVTIGGDVAPAKGALLDLNSDEGARGGLLFSNVVITDVLKIPAGLVGSPGAEDDGDKAALVGSVVYNLNTSENLSIPAGLYVWNGAKWLRLTDAEAVQTGLTTKQDKLNGGTGFLTAPSEAGGQPGTVATTNYLQSPEAQSASTQLMLAPATKGGVPTLQALSTFVQTSGSQSINGVKTFSDGILVKAKSSTVGTSNTEVATEKQVYDVNAKFKAYYASYSISYNSTLSGNALRVFSQNNILYISGGVQFSGTPAQDGLMFTIGSCQMVVSSASNVGSIKITTTPEKDKRAIGIIKAANNDGNLQIIAQDGWNHAPGWVEIQAIIPLAP